MMVKVTLDLSRLLQEGRITREEHDRLALLGRRGTGSLLVNALIGFGVVGVSAGIVALLPSVLTAIPLGLVLMSAGAWLVLRERRRWDVLATILILVGALLLGASLLLLSSGQTTLNGAPPGGAGKGRPLLGLPAAYLLVATLFAGSAILARSGLLVALAVLLLSAALGSGTSYDHAFYALSVQQPLATILAFSALAAAAHAGAPQLRAAGERLANIAARTALLLVQLGFWVGSLWGDDADWIRRSLGRPIPADTFSIAWAAVLLLAAIWAGRTNRLWTLNLACIFGGIHFYTQWFESFGAAPLSLLGGGVLMLAFALGLWRLNERRAEG
ncbi:hypothetical protein SAMN02745194_03673 [Roseomonas rosea]|uniref:DUF2157 domain-containing protein n=1 Tax=Muricoccus roseus TaxID=198092 RepID=A0A1M6N2A3_9PROT|nr:hypothetical protein [Roseomonas rosea]SHJ89821.1 hypothetical protein SAMN02745194_03673 [Roseomonas rosea]